MLTLDNASNCNTMMEHFQKLLEEYDKAIKFHAESNRVRCTEHIFNIAVQTALNAITETNFEVEVPAADTTASEGEGWARYSTAALDRCAKEVLSKKEAYRIALSSDPVGIVRKLINGCCASHLRREDLQAAIVHFNDTLPKGEVKLHVLELLRDMEVRWSSTFLMIDRLLYLYRVVKQFATSDKYAEELAALLPTNMEMRVIQDIRTVLYTFHIVQEALAAEKTPTLSRALPAYEMLVKTLHGIAELHLPELGHAIGAAIRKLQEYFQKSRQTHSYVLAMIINPEIKFAWLEENWTAEEIVVAKKYLVEAMMEYRAAQCTQATAEPSGAAPTQAHTQPRPVRSSSGSASIASRAQDSAFARLGDLMAFYNKPPAASATSMSNQSPAATPSGSNASSVPMESEEQRKQRLNQEDKHAAEEELRKYTSTPRGLTSSVHSGPIDLVQYWKEKELEFPLLFLIAMDVLPIQASSVPSERVFSSSKETDTMRCSRLSPQTIEILQILKYTFRQEHLSFTDHWIPSEQELAAAPFTQEDIEKLVAEKRFLDVLKIVAAHHRNEPPEFPVVDDDEDDDA